VKLPPLLGTLTVIVAVPALFGVTVPSAVTDATEGVFEYQVTVGVVEPDAAGAVAVNLYAVPPLASM
jgi:hypothetical protein